MTVGQVLKATLKRRGLRYGEYLLERKGDPGVRLDHNQSISELEERIQGPVEFVLIRKYSEPSGGRFLVSPPSSSSPTPCKAKGERKARRKSLRRRRWTPRPRSRTP